jgi:hypothetical protein
MEINNIEIIIGALVAISGWFIGYFLTNKRNRKQKKIDISVNYLIEAYRTMSQEIAPITWVFANKDRKVLQKILSDIQLFGTLDQINLAEKIIKEIDKGGEVEFTTIINNLRDELREQLGLEQTNNKVSILRFFKNKSALQ